MAAITFPGSPALNDIHTVGNRSWQYNGIAWKLVPKTTDAITEGSNNLYYTEDRVAAAPAVTALDTRVTSSEGRLDTVENRLSNAKISSYTGEHADLETRLERTDSDVANLQSDVGVLQSDVSGLQSTISGIGSAFSYRGTVEGQPEESATDLTASTETSPGSYYKVATTGYVFHSSLRGGQPFLVNQGDGIVFNNSGTVDVIDNTNSTVAGSDWIDVTGSSDTGFTVSLNEGLYQRISQAESDIDSAENRLTDAESAINDRVTQDSLNATVETINDTINGVSGTVFDLTGRTYDLEQEVSNARGANLTVADRFDALESGKQIKNVLAATAPSHVEGLIWIDTTDMSSYVSYGEAWVEMDRI